MCPEVLKAGIKFALHLIIDHSGDTYSAGIGQLFQACCNVHAITVEVVTIDHEVTHVHADAKDDGTTVRRTKVLLGNEALNVYGAVYCVDRAAELNQRSISHELDGSAPMLGDEGIDHARPQLLKRTQRACLIRPHEAAVANYVG